jgi:ribosomal protein S18 acetylase RimI-like enzyme
VLAAIEATMPSQHHQTRYAVQRDGGGLYLIALLDGRPAGHVLLRRQTTNEALLRWGVSEPHLEALGVAPPLRSQGIGTVLIQAAEGAVLQQGQACIGLAVGVANTRGRALYERLGYVQMSYPPFEASWSYYDDDGQKRVASETCVYMTKRLGRSSAATSPGPSV